MKYMIFETCSTNGNDRKSTGDVVGKHEGKKLMVQMYARNAQGCYREEEGSNSPASEASSF
jgi:hypothetical protein